MNQRSLSVTAGISYIIIFFSAIFANFFVIESLLKSPLETVQESSMMISLGIIAFLITVIFDVVVAWALYELYKKNTLSILSSLFRMMHASIMGVAIYRLPLVLDSTTSQDILQHIHIFNIIWLIGLFFFGIHLILLGKIIGKPKLISIFLTIAGIMYMIDTVAQFSLTEYQDYASIFLILVAIPSIVGEMSLAVWLLLKNGKS